MLYYNQLQTGLLLVSGRLRCRGVSTSALGSGEGCEPRAVAGAQHCHTGPEPSPATTILQPACTGRTFRPPHNILGCDFFPFFIRVFTFYVPLGVDILLFPCFELGVMIKEAWEICAVVLEGYVLDGFHVY